MFNSSSCYSLADIAAATGNNNGNGWGENGSWWIIILFLFVICGWGNNGWNNGGGNGAQGALTRGELCQDMNFADLETAVRGVQSGICDGFYAMNTGMMNGFSTTQAAIANGFSGVDNAICTVGNQIQQGFNNATIANMQSDFALQQAINGVQVGNMQNTNALQTQIQQCCCNNEALLADIKYALATNACAYQTALANSTRDIIDNQNCGVRSILDFYTQNKMNELQNENQVLRFEASQQAQNNYLVSTLRPAAVPSFSVAPPYQYTNCCTNNNNCCGNAVNF